MLKDLYFIFQLYQGCFHHDCRIPDLIMKYRFFFYMTVSFCFSVFYQCVTITFHCGIYVSYGQRHVLYVSVMGYVIHLVIINFAI